MWFILQLTNFSNSSSHPLCGSQFFVPVPSYQDTSTHHCETCLVCWHPYSRTTSSPTKIGPIGPAEILLKIASCKFHITNWVQWRFTSLFWRTLSSFQIPDLISGTLRHFVEISTSHCVCVITQLTWPNPINQSCYSVQSWRKMTGPSTHHLWMATAYSTVQ